MTLCVIVSLIDDRLFVLRTDDYLFRYTYFGIALGCTLLIIPAYIIVFIKVRKESKRTTQQLVNSPRRKALKIFARKVFHKILTGLMT
jgi:hypothetical protein